MTPLEVAGVAYYSTKAFTDFLRVGLGGFEPPITCVSDKRLARLSYKPI